MLLARCDRNGCLTSFWYCILGQYEVISHSIAPIKRKHAFKRKKSVNLRFGSRVGSCPPQQPHCPVDPATRCLVQVYTGNIVSFLPAGNPKRSVAHDHFPHRSIPFRLSISQSIGSFLTPPARRLVYYRPLWPISSSRPGPSLILAFAASIFIPPKLALTTPVSNNFSGPKVVSLHSVGDNRSLKLTSCCRS